MHARHSMRVCLQYMRRNNTLNVVVFIYVLLVCPRSQDGTVNKFFVFYLLFYVDVVFFFAVVVFFAQGEG